MPFPIWDLIKDRSIPIVISSDKNLDEALRLMEENDFSQLPVVDLDGRSDGIITSDSVIRSLRRFALMPDKMRVIDAKKKVSRFSIDDDLFEALSALADEGAFVICDDQEHVVGIVTDFDTSTYFRRRAEDLMLVEDVEGLLREYILLAFPGSLKSGDDPALLGAVQRAAVPLGDTSRLTAVIEKYLEKAGCVANDNHQAAILETQAFVLEGIKRPKKFEDLNFGECVTMLFSGGRWAQYSEAVPLDKGAITRLLGLVREIRNKVAHFRGEVTGVERETLRTCLNWLQNYKPAVMEAFKVVVKMDERPAPTDEESDEREVKPHEESPRIESVAGNEVNTFDLEEEHAHVRGTVISRPSKYYRLGRWLKGVPPDTDTTWATFTKIEEIIRAPLPPFARAHRSWWANERNTRAQSRQWLAAGWKVDFVDMADGNVRFRRLTSDQINALSSDRGAEAE